MDGGGRADVMAHLEYRPGKPKMRHPGTFNANPLSASAGVAALRIVAEGGACRRNEIGRLLRQRLNQLFAERALVDRLRRVLDVPSTAALSRAAIRRR